MKKQTKKPSKQPSHTWKKALLLTVAILLGLAILAVLVIYLWPLRRAELQTITRHTLSYQQAIDRIASLRHAEQVRGVTPECESRLLTHGHQTAKSVVMFHGVADCSKQFSDLAQYFYDQGYNVYVPTAPKHGTANDLGYSQVSAKELADAAVQSSDIVAGLGSDPGAIGLSGGGVMGTWLVQHDDRLKHFLALSPFYEPSRSQAPAWKVRPFFFLYGNHILPDTFSVAEDGGRGLSYYALVQFALLGKNLPHPAADTGLKTVGLAMAADDDLINQPLAATTLSAIAKANHLQLQTYELPAEWKVGHVIVGPKNTDLDTHRAELYARYFAMYNS